MSRSIPYQLIVLDWMIQMGCNNAVSLQVHYVLNQAPPGWTGGVGHISEKLIRLVTRGGP